ncbi:MAG: tRNA (adenosine(37)-N6)-threonylcarbamoyltransferase complex transferase subunit TsaD [Bacillales bacterium]|jgi:N6-L-threonylcarbamoyladenine synthase|nr:tRNA (adenosine(37)-N6)-threonylcarbamoyltransferase complex transferase subunit TsaD [Bacillales bacterium]
MKKYILAIETSCDDTCIAVLENDKVLSSVISSQIQIHALSGGVIPEVASRLHEQNIFFVLDEALKKANITLNDLKAIGVTIGPGLIGSLQVGLQLAKTLAVTLNIPYFPIHHLAGHLLANLIENKIAFPALGIIVSGGNSELVLLNDYFDYEILGDTLDDAIGEMLDKVGRVLGLPYPSGPIIDKMAKLGENKYHFPIPKIEGYNFSFSGLKTNLINFIHKREQNQENLDLENICCSLQESAFAQILNKTKLILETYPIKSILLGGGVAANSKLREKILNLETDNLKIYLPKLMYSMDNAAMIGVVTNLLIDNYQSAELTISAKPNYKLNDWGDYLNGQKKT